MSYTNDDYDIDLWVSLNGGFITKNEYLELINEYEEPWESNSMWCS